MAFAAPLDPTMYTASIRSNLTNLNRSTDEIRKQWSAVWEPHGKSEKWFLKAPLVYLRDLPLNPQIGRLKP